jgi:probable addiction module antidote protein
VTVKTFPSDVAATLDSEGRIAAYINVALETNDAAYIAHALGTVARARGMTQIARDAGVSRVSLYRALSEDGNPELSTLLRVMRAIGLQLQAAPADPGVNQRAKSARSRGTQGKGTARQRSRRKIAA